MRNAGKGSKIKVDLGCGALLLFRRYRDQGNLGVLGVKLAVWVAIKGNQERKLFLYGKSGIRGEFRWGGVMFGLCNLDAARPFDVVGGARFDTENLVNCYIELKANRRLVST